MADREERLTEALQRIGQWCDAYPVTVFRPLSDDDIRRAGEVLKAGGIDMGALHAGWARHLLSGIADIAHGALR